MRLNAPCDKMEHLLADKYSHFKSICLEDDRYCNALRVKALQNYAYGLIIVQFIDNGESASL